jgi:hypothetical protein
MSPSKPKPLKTDSSPLPDKSAAPAAIKSSAALGTVKDRPAGSKAAKSIPAPQRHAETFGNYVVHCATGEPNGLPLRIFCQEMETPQEARAATQKLLDAQHPARDPSAAWKIIKVEYLGVGIGKGGFGS